jgi:glycosyltransferase involved in cell wall biosynthesis
MIAVIFILIVYSVLVMLLWIGWMMAMPKKISQQLANEELISVIVPIRNEAERIQILLNSLVTQRYSNFEIIVVDDHSEDDTLSRLQVYSQKVTILSSTGFGKKTAITTGIHAANGKIIVTTDGDCVAPPEWLQGINHEFLNKKIQLAFGAVNIQQSDTLFSKLQSLEFTSLIGSSGATAILKMPVMCNGANLAYRKHIFDEVNGYESDLHVASGDDEFLMRKIHKRYPDGIGFISSDGTVIETGPQKSLHAFFMQRLRWAGKWKENSSAAAKSLGLFILITQCCWLIGLFGLVVSFNLTVAVVLVIKAAVEFLFLYHVNKFLRNKWSWLAFCMLQVFYSPYVIITGIGSLFIVPVWKGRKIK